MRRRIRDYALARADDPSRTRYAGPITVVFGAVLGVLVSLCSLGAGALGLADVFEWNILDDIASACADFRRPQ